MSRYISERDRYVHPNANFDAQLREINKKRQEENVGFESDVEKAEREEGGARKKRIRPQKRPGGRAPRPQPVPADADVDQTAEESALHRTETDRNLAIERERENIDRRRGEAMTRAEQARIAEKEALQSELVVSPEMTPEELHLAQREIERDHQLERGREDAGRARSGEAARVEQARVGEREGQSEQDPVVQAKQRMCETRENYERFFGQARAQRRWYQKILDVNVERNEEVVAARNQWQQARSEYIQVRINRLREELRGGGRAEAEIRQEVSNFIRFLEAEESVSAAEGKNRQFLDHNVERGWWSRRVVEPYTRAVEAWRRLPWYTKIGAAVAVGMVGGYVALTAGAVMRLLGAGITAKAVQEKLQASADQYRYMQIEGRITTAEAIMGREGRSIEESLNRLESFLRRENENLGRRLSRQGATNVRNRRLGIFAGIGLFTGGTLFSLYNQGYFGGKGGAASVPEGPKGPVVPEAPGKFSGSGLEHTGHGEFSGDFARIPKGGSIWKSTREIFMKYPEEYGYNEGQTKNLFNSFREQGILKRLGIRGINNFDDLSLEQKHKIWAEWKTGIAINNYKLLHGGKITDLVHPGDSVRLDEHGKLFFVETSGMKAGYLDDVRGHGAGRAVAEVFDGKYHRPALVDAKWQAAQVKAEAASAVHRAARDKLLEATAAEQAAIDNTRMHSLMDYIQGKIYGQGTFMDWREPAKEFKKRMLGSFITSDQPMGPPANIHEQQQFWNAAKEICERLGDTVGNESTADWVRRGLESKKISPEEVIQVFSRVANE